MENTEVEKNLRRSPPTKDDALPSATYETEQNPKI